jgi:hypothetical protein
VLNVYRAATQSITHDEALAFQMFIGGTWPRQFAYVGVPSHVLFNVLAKASTIAFGLSEFSLRLPSVFASALYCVASARIVTRVIESELLRVVAFSLLVLDPYTLDFMSAARGYGLMLALLFASLAVLPLSPHREVTTSEATLVGVLLGLAIAANQVAIVPATGIVVSYLFLATYQRQPDCGVKRALLIASASAMTSVPFLVSYIRHAHGADYYVGAGTIRVSIASFARASWDHVKPDVASWAEITTWQSVIAGFGVVIGVAIVALALTCLIKGRMQTTLDYAIVFVAVMMASMGVSILVLHATVGVLYPEGRTGLYWLPLIGLSAAMLVASVRTHTAFWFLGCALLGIVLIKDLVKLQVSRYADWPYDSASRTIVTTIERDHGDSNTPVSVGGSWQLEPSLNFYRSIRHLGWLRPIERRNPARGDDYYVLTTEDALFVAALRLRPMFVDLRSGTILAKPQF